MTSKPNDPPRLTELSSDAPSELRSLFEFARRDVPTDSLLTDLATRVGPILERPSNSGPDFGGGSAPPGDSEAPTTVGTSNNSSGTTAGAAAVAGGGAAKALSAAVITSLLGAALWLGTRHSNEQPVVADGEQQPRAVSKLPAASPQAAAMPAPAIPAPTSGDVIRPATAPSPAVSVVRADVDSISDRVFVKPPPGLSASGEAQILERAHALLKTDPQQSLVLAQQHARLYPRPELAKERDAIAVEALRRLGREDEAAEKLEAFKRMPAQR